ncbi:MAG: (Fe-S)-binding protein [Thermodesulfobacteriota bacterium]
MGDTKDKIKQIYDALPHLNCGQCGFEGCGQFAKAVAEGRASPFGCRQDPWAGYRISEIMGEKAFGMGPSTRLGQSRPVFGQERTTPAPAAIGSLRAEVGEMSRRVQAMLTRIGTLERKGAGAMPKASTIGFVDRIPGTGRGLGRGGGGGMGGRRLSVGGQCICPNCGYKATHQGSTPCYRLRCPQCGSPMAR